ncbi:MAG: aspartate kinase [Proteobacteria bacterium]|jgi:aspartate kinase|nr:aspartate kinase [Pseudomonadota bacterium]MBT5066574.1 aspartate kinase [Pseudomonadota bacterium]MBT6192402.1 aspartate kinase [Pseudomonadota bacterium]MBT6465314.1 aspartate kinase [Pseudomonadota bacterium]MBT7246201.1 aspartate kinase [Pseudomonadota bacterium]
MSLIVQKFGGTSVGDAERIKNVASRIARSCADGNSILVVLSAMSGETDRLLSLAKSIVSDPRGRETDVLLSTGEQVSIALLSMALEELGVPAVSFTGSQVKILTDNIYNKARIEDIDSTRLRATLDDGKVAVVAGFQGVDAEGNITTLGRGGSDTTAVALAAALEADECQIYTDVDGVYTTDPRIVPEARRLSQVTYEEMLEMASLGAKVLQIRAVEFASKYKVKLRVLSSFCDGIGTLITTEENIMEEALISGVTLNRNEAQVMMVGVPDRPGVASSILGPVADANIEVDMIVQNSAADGATDFTFTVSRDDYDLTLKILNEIAETLSAREVRGDRNIVKLSIVGVGMRSHAGIASRMFKALSKENINILMISTSEIKISIVVDQKYSELGVRVLHSEFGLSEASGVK